MHGLMLLVESILYVCGCGDVVNKMVVEVISFLKLFVPVYNHELRPKFDDYFET